MTVRPLDRIVFGTARLAGGAYARPSRQLIETCLNYGITRFDTAPSYGMGAAEKLLGEVIAGVPDVEIATKLGALRPSYPALRGWAKLGYRLSGLRNADGAETGPIRSHCGPLPGMNHSGEGCLRSFERSLKLLKRDHIDLLLLHEAEPAEVPTETVALLKRWQSEGRISTVGVGHQGPVGTLPSGWVAQIAPDIDEFSRSAADPSPRRFHSIRNTSAWAVKTNVGLAQRLDFVVEQIGGGDPQGLAPMALLAVLHPQSRLIYATTAQDRLETFIRTWNSLDLGAIAKAGQ